MLILNLLLRWWQHDNSIGRRCSARGKKSPDDIYYTLFTVLAEQLVYMMFNFERCRIYWRHLPDMGCFRYLLEKTRNSRIKDVLEKHENKKYIIKYCGFIILVLAASEKIYQALKGPGAF